MKQHKVYVISTWTLRLTEVKLLVLVVILILHNLHLIVDLILIVAFIARWWAAFHNLSRFMLKRLDICKSELCKYLIILLIINNAASACLTLNMF